MKTVTITIGLASRDGVAMDGATSRGFIACVGASVEACAEKMHFHGKGVGDSAQWGTEPAYTWVVTMPAKEVEGLRRYLAVDAALYSQDAIAMTVGEVEFVTP